MKTIADYNALMVGLPSGRTGAELSQATDDLADQINQLKWPGGLATAADPIAHPVLASIGQLAALADELRTDQELRSALIAGQGPVNQLIDELRTDAADKYDIHRTHGGLALNRLEEEVG